jgi:hypothetical protein
MFSLEVGGFVYSLEVLPGVLGINILQLLIFKV